eukprot:TRINITY_DN18951_c0_g1_i2.p1 TRINITY_DN18951_c0_g1~~TRINITY_DN18951_c0_g1_i2.p1  ORF type:complete len:525 (+),score=117.81 TRINITY_DN18951_c0_g1_i2:144-1577(+)
MAASASVPPVDVCIIGNGPAGLALSHALAGNGLFVEGSARDPELERVAAQLRATPQRPVHLHDLPALCTGMRGRCINALAALIDRLRYPVGDGQGRSLVSVRPGAHAAISQAVIGSGKPGGSWHAMPESMITLSPGEWMALPGLTLAEYLDGLRRAGQQGVPPASSRLERRFVAQYYEEYARRFVPPGAMQQGRVTRAVPPAAPGGLWELHGRDAAGAERLLARSKSVVLAMGMYDRPRRLGIEGEGHGFVSHRPRRPPAEEQGTLLVLGAGLSAVDALIAWLMPESLSGGPPVLHPGRRAVHVFRTAPGDTKFVRMFGGVTEGAEGQLIGLMTGTRSSDQYEIYPHSTVSSIAADGNCSITGPGGSRTLRADRVSLLVGSDPDLELLPAELRARLPPEPIMGLTKTNGDPSTHPLWVPVDPGTFEARGADGAPLAAGLFAVGPLRGDNFVRFVVGDAYGVLRRLTAGAEQQPQGEL